MVSSTFQAIDFDGSLLHNHSLSVDATIIYHKIAQLLVKRLVLFS